MNIIVLCLKVCGIIYYFMDFTPHLIYPVITNLLKNWSEEMLQMKNVDIAIFFSYKYDNHK